MRRLIIGDIHAHYDMLRAVLDKASFDPGKDILYSVGDILDHGDKPVETLRFLMSLPSFRPVLGNHDAWFESFLWNEDKPDPVWIEGNGGDRTSRAVLALPQEERKRMRDWLASFPLIRVEDDIIIVHGGIPYGYKEKDLLELCSIPRRVPFAEDSSELLSKGLPSFLWDRDYLYSAMKESGWRRRGREAGRYIKPMDTRRTIFIGHTQLRPECVPFISKRFHLSAIDTGTGSGLGPLTVMDMDSGEYWQAKADGIRL